MPTIQPPAISDGRSKTHPRETELVEKPSGFWVEIPDTDLKSIRWRSAFGEVFYAAQIALNPDKGIFAKYRLEDRDGVKQKVLVPLHEVAMTQPNDHQTIIWKLAEKVETIFKNRARHDMIMATFPSGYKFYHYLFETKAQKEARLNGQASKGKAKNKEFTSNGIVFYRKDPYLLGHPSGTSNRFRSTNEMKPHIIWLAYGLYATKNVQVPKSDVEWTCRDFALCPCGLCPKFLSKYETNFMDPLRSRMVLGANEEFRFLTKSNPALFRLFERGFLRIKISRDGSIELADPVPTKLALSQSKSKIVNQEGITYWPVEITGRKLVLDGTAVKLGSKGRSKKLIGDRRGSEDQDGSDDVGSWLFENSMALYTVSLLGNFEDGPMEFTDVHTSCLCPFLEVLPRQYELPFPSYIAPKTMTYLAKKRKEGLDEIKKSASKWKKLNSHAILFGNEVIRIGDVLRQRRANDSGPLKSIVARQFVFRPDEPDFLVSGAQWTLDNRFSITCARFGTRMAAWLPVQDLCETRIRAGKTTLVRMHKILGRRYPINAPGLKASTYLGASIWQDWHNIENMQMPILLGYPEGARNLQNVPLKMDDSDLSWNGEGRHLLTGRPRMAIEAVPTLKPRVTKRQHYHEEDDDDDEYIPRKKSRRILEDDDDEPNDPRPVVASTSGSFVNSKASASTSSEKVFAEESDDEVPLARIKGNGIGSNINFGSSELAYNTAATNLSDAQAQNWKVVKLEDADAADLPEAQNGTLKAVKVEDEDANITTPDSQSHLVPSETLEDGGSFIPANVNDEDLLFSASPSLDGSEDEIVPLEDYGDFDDMDLVTDDSDDDEPVPNLPICVGPNYKKYGVATFVSWADKEAKEIFPEYYQLAKYDVEDFWRE